MPETLRLYGYIPARRGAITTQEINGFEIATKLDGYDKWFKCIYSMCIQYFKQLYYNFIE